VVQVAVFVKVTLNLGTPMRVVLEEKEMKRNRNKRELEREDIFEKTKRQNNSWLLDLNV
jgi:hypothetical protein